MPHIVCIVGKSKTGKTTLIERLVAEFKRRKRKVATIKHHLHDDVELDVPGKDSWRHAQAGSDAVVLSTPYKVALIKKVDHDPTLDELNQLIGIDYDIVLAEGFKEIKAARKIEVHRKEIGGELLCTRDELIAIATDEPLDMTVSQYSLDDISGLADLIERRFLGPEKREWVTLFINGAKVPIKDFVQDFVAKTVIGMVSALKRVKKTETIELSVRKKRNGDG